MAKKSVEKQIKDGLCMSVKTIATTFLITYGGLTWLQLPAYFSDKVNSQETLERMVSEERKKFQNNKDYDVNVRFFYGDISQSAFFINGKYEIRIGGQYANRNSVKHELEHIFSGDLKKKATFDNKIGEEIYYLFWDEPRATLYETFDLKF